MVPSPSANEETTITTPPKTSKSNIWWVTEPGSGPKAWALVCLCSPQRSRHPPAVYPTTAARPFWLAAWWPSSCCCSSSSSSSSGASVSARCWRRWANKRPFSVCPPTGSHVRFYPVSSPRVHDGSLTKLWRFSCRPAATPSSSRPPRCPPVLDTPQVVCFRVTDRMMLTMCWWARRHRSQFLLMCERNKRNIQ